ncbi:MAG: hypothetical protein BYD32DRAFT_266378 [Podila humilis]|nr:MAG: hypothetical protein BYD32DRAFT_266378 [Podila humilis]
MLCLVACLIRLLHQTLRSILLRIHLPRASASLVLKQLIDVIVPPLCPFAWHICSGIEKRTKRTPMCACMHASIQNKKK